jgi:hypothetical protein
MRDWGQESYQARLADPGYLEWEEGNGAPIAQPEAHAVLRWFSAGSSLRLE